MLRGHHFLNFAIVPVPDRSTGMSGGRSAWMEEDELEAVVARALDGEREAFADLYHKFYRRVFGLCRYLLNSADAAEDATNEVFLRAQRAMNTYDRALPLSGWLLSIASHYCMDLLRRWRVESRLFDTLEGEPLDPEMPGVGPLGELLAAERSDRVRAAVADLPARFRVPLVLRYYGELSYDQIAGMTGLRRSQVAILIFRSKKELRRVLAVPQGGYSR